VHVIDNESDILAQAFPEDWILKKVLTWLGTEAPHEERTYLVGTMINNTSDVIRLKDRRLGRKMPSQLFEGCYDIPLLFTRRVDIAEEKDLPMTAGHKEDAGGVVPLGIPFLSLLVGGLEGRLASINHVLWD
jgi:hypothetical protein